MFHARIRWEFSGERQVKGQTVRTSITDMAVFHRQDLNRGEWEPGSLTGRDIAARIVAALPAAAAAHCSDLRIYAEAKAQWYSDRAGVVGEVEREIDVLVCRLARGGIEHTNEHGARVVYDEESFAAMLSSAEFAEECQRRMDWATEFARDHAREYGRLEPRRTA